MKKRNPIIILSILILAIMLIKLYNQNSNTSILDNTKDILLVNSEHSLDKNYVPDNLITPNIKFTNESSKDERMISKTIEKPLEDLIDTAKKENIILLGNSAYRSYNLQKKIYEKRVKTEGKKMADSYVSKPGFSEHQTGLCIDLTDPARNISKGTKEAKWLSKNCYKFGFILRYPEGKEKITKISYEPWHIRYVGKEAAKYIHDNDITLEEYLDKKGL